MINSLQFWTLVAGLLAFLLTNLFAIPVSPEQVLMVTLILLGLLGIYPKLRARLLRVPDIFKSMEFWVMVAGLVGFVVRFYFPAFPLDTAAILAIFVFLLRLIGVDPQVLQQDQALDLVVIQVIDEQVRAVAVMSDGLTRLALKRPNNEPHPPFFKPLFAFVQSSAFSNDAVQANDALTEFLSSPRVCERTDDDKTLVLALRSNFQ